MEVEKKREGRVRNRIEEKRRGREEGRKIRWGDSEFKSKGKKGGCCGLGRWIYK